MRVLRLAALHALLALFVAVITLPARAMDTLAFGQPGYFTVTGVASDDVLNIRAEPNASSQIIGGFAPGAGPIEVIATDGNWAEVIMGEGNGWVSLRFLTKTDVPVVGETQLPVGLACSGTEPFWSARFTSALEVLFEELGLDEKVLLGVEHAAPAVARIDLSTVWVADSDGLPGVIMVRGQRCSDGMSDRTYGYSTAVSLKTSDGARTYDGCCWLQPPR